MKAILPALFASLALAGAAHGQAKAPAAKAPPRPPAAGGFDAQNPQTLIDILAALGAKASVSEKVEDSVFLKVTSPAGDFGVQFAGCDKQGRKCQAMGFDAPANASAPTLQQLNAFNQTSLMCRVWQARDGKPHVTYAALVSGSDSRAEIETQLAAWRGCLADFGAFLKDPPGYLATAP